MTVTTLRASEVNLDQVDKNFKPATVGDLAVHYYNAFEAPFELTGFAWRAPGAKLCRLPETFTDSEVNGGALWLAHCTAGGAIRFRTNSPCLTLRAKLWYTNDMNHMPRGGSAGFDLYQRNADGKEQYLSTAHPSAANLQGELFETKLGTVNGNAFADFTLYLPLYSGVESLELGIAPGSELLPPPPQAFTKPVVFYGSSITQGGCASRPANNYTTMLCRAIDAPQVNLGFSGSAKGEIAVAEAIAELEMTAFVFDYDHNADSVDDLKQTHEPFFQKIRAAHPDLPIIIITSPPKTSPFPKERREVIKATCDRAAAAGDKKVWFIDGAELFGEAGINYCTVDGVHPNDLGFYQMYLRVLPTLKTALGME